MSDQAHAISATVDGAPQKWEFQDLDSLMGMWRAFATSHLVPGTDKRALDMELTIAGKVCARIPNEGWLSDNRPEYNP